MHSVLRQPVKVIVGRKRKCDSFKRENEPQFTVQVSCEGWPTAITCVKACVLPLRTYGPRHDFFTRTHTWSRCFVTKRQWSNKDERRLFFLIERIIQNFQSFWNGDVLPGTGTVYRI